MSELRRDIPSLSTGPDRTLAEYLAKNSPTFVRLEAVRKQVGAPATCINFGHLLILFQGWNNPEGDRYWQNRREQSDTATEDAARAFYDMTKQIAEEMQAKTSALTPGDLGIQPFQVLDLCMAPGGFTWGTLEYNPDAIAYGITLPLEIGGYKNWFTLSAEYVKFMDITMLASEFGIGTIPTSHPDHSLFLAERPFVDQRFQLIFCGGAVLRGHERSEHRREFERTRLTTSQLILAMQRIIPGGTMVILLRRPDTWDVVHLLHQFNSFANIQLFKPYKKHAVRSTFYLVAKNVQPEAESANAALEEWKKSWSRATFGGDEGTGEKDPEMDVEAVKKVLDEFGPKLIELAIPVWKIQAGALERQDFTKTRNDGRKKQRYWPKKRG
jgi:23S rRNA U2552 (ribose-2'-O)-methylase RlmE/FtsJ